MENTKKKIIYKKRGIGHYSVLEKKSFPFAYLMILFPVAQLALFFIYVNFSTIFLAFQNDAGQFSFEYIQKAFNSFITDVDFADSNLHPRSMLIKSILLWLNIHGVAFVISFFTSFILTKHMIWSRFFRTVFYIPVIVGGVVFCRIMQGFYEGGGPIMTLLENTSLFESFNIHVQNGGLLASEQTAYATLMIQSFILTISGGHMVIAGAFMKVPEEIFESARLDGVGFFREAFQIAIPCVWPTLSTLIVFSLCSFFVCDYNFYLYSNGTGDNGIQSIGLRIYMLTVTVSQNAETAGGLYNYSSAFGMLLTLVTLPLVFFGRWLLTKIGDDSVAF